jgi:competence protein ComEA
LKLTKEEKTILLTIVIAAVIGLLINFFMSYNKKIEIKAKSEDVLMVNINTATAADFDKLPGIGRTLAERIVKEREKKGGFKAVEELKGIKGITAKRFEQMKKYIIITEE